MSVDEPSPPAEQVPPVAPSAGGAVSVPPSSDSGIQVNVDFPAQLDKGLSILRWYGVFLIGFFVELSLVPSAIILVVLALGAVIVGIISWFTVLFTKRVPAGLFNYQLMVIRFYLRLESWICLMHDEFPLKFDDEGALTVYLEYPESIPRWRGIPLVSYIMALPQLIVGGIIIFIGRLLVVLPPIIPGVVPLIVLFTGNTSEGIFNFVRGGMRLYGRGIAYAAMLAPRWEFSMD